MPYLPALAFLTGLQYFSNSNSMHPLQAGRAAKRITTKAFHLTITRTICISLLMKKLIHCGIFFFIALLIAAPFTTIKAQAKSNAPYFNDGGKIIDSLKRNFACEAIEFENTADNKKADSCLTVYLINSASIFSEYDLGKQAPSPLKNVASAVKRSLTNPNHYKTIYVFLVNRYKQNGKDMTIRTAGLEISTKVL